MGDDYDLMERDDLQDFSDREAWEDAMAEREALEAWEDADDEEILRRAESDLEDAEALEEIDTPFGQALDAGCDDGL